MQNATTASLCSMFPCICGSPTRGNPPRAEILELPQGQARVPLIRQPEEVLVLVLVLVFFFTTFKNSYLTSERKLLRVGFTKSVVVILTFEEKVISILVPFPFGSVWVVVQGRGQSDTEIPATKKARVS